MPKFLHLADVHLGNQQSGARESTETFTHAYLNIVQEAIDNKVDFVVLPGDLFDKNAIDANTLTHAMSGLKRLKKAGIPTIAVEGNHEQPYYKDDNVGWMQWLADRDMLTLLGPKFEDDDVALEKYDPKKRRGAYTEPIPGVRVYGMGYYSDATPMAINKVTEKLSKTSKDGVDYTVFMAHTGTDKYVSKKKGGLTKQELAGLRPHVDYLALGHVHRPYQVDDWIYNPGSPENCAPSEEKWKNRGYYIVDLDTKAKRGKKHKATLHSNPRRPVRRQKRRRRRKQGS